jgi:hypothetical protein
MSAGLWKPADDDQLREMAASGKGPSEIARLLHRSPSAVRKRASLLGIAVQLVEPKGKQQHCHETFVDGVRCCLLRRIPRSGSQRQAGLAAAATLLRG